MSLTLLSRAAHVLWYLILLSFSRLQLLIQHFSPPWYPDQSEPLVGGKGQQKCNRSSNKDRLTWVTSGSVEIEVSAGRKWDSSSENVTSFNLCNEAKGSRINRMLENPVHVPDVTILSTTYSSCCYFPVISSLLSTVSWTQLIFLWSHDCSFLSTFMHSQSLSLRSVITGTSLSLKGFGREKTCRVPFWSRAGSLTLKSVLLTFSD